MSIKVYATKPLLMHGHDIDGAIDKNIVPVKPNAKTRPVPYIVPRDGHYSFNVVDVQKKTIKKVPDCVFIRSFIEQGILIQVGKATKEVEETEEIGEVEKSETIKDSDRREKGDKGAPG